MNYSYSSSLGGAGGVIWALMIIAFYVIVIVGGWKTYVKAGHPGWGVIIPFYNIWLWVKIAGRPPSWFWIILVGVLLSWIPIVGWLLAIAIWIMMLFLALDVAKNFGHGGGFGVLLWLFAPIMMLILGFGDSQYRQVAHPETAAGSYGGGGYASPPPPPPVQSGQTSASQPLAPPPPPPPISAPPEQAAPPASDVSFTPPASSEPPAVPPAAPEPPVVPPAPPAPPTT